MCKGADESRVWADVGYNVNGGQNGVWSPGSYGVAWNTYPRDIRRHFERWVKAVLGVELDWSADGWDPTTDPENEEPTPDAMAEAKALAAMLFKANLEDYGSA